MPKMVRLVTAYILCGLLGLLAVGVSVAEARMAGGASRAIPWPLRRLLRRVSDEPASPWAS
jgi:hypothetical protein